MANTEQTTIRGKITSVIRKTSPKGKEYAEIYIDDQKASAWNDHTIVMAEMCVDNSALVTLSRKVGSNWWNVDSVEPQEGDPIPMSVPQQRVSDGGTMPSSSGKVPYVVEERRRWSVEHAITCLSNASNKDRLLSATEVTDYAMILEQYLIQNEG